MSTTIKELARIAGVSHTLVSGILSNNPRLRVSQETRSRILKLCCEHDCRPNRVAQRLRGGDLRTVFILTRSEPSSGHIVLQNEASALLEKNGYQIFAAGTSSSEQTARQIAEISNLGCNGILSCYTHYIPAGDSRIPTVVVSDYSDVPHDLGVDREYGTRLLMRHLFGHGHARIGFVCCLRAGVEEMISGYRAMYRQRRMAFSDSWLVDCLYNDRSLEEILGLIRKDGVTALVCADDFIAGQLMALLIRRGIRVPEDVAVTGTNAMTFAGFTPVPLTTLIYPYRRLGEAAARLLLDRMKGRKRKASGKTMLRPRLFLGESCGCRGSFDWRMPGIVSGNLLEEQLANDRRWRSETR